MHRSDDFMEDSSVDKVNKADSQTPLGMSRFDSNERHKFGQNVRSAVVCIEGSAELINTKVVPSAETGIH
jgi:hypothetical protein